MKKITKAEFDGLGGLRSKNSEFFDEIKKLKVGEGLSINDSEWPPQKTNYYGVIYFWARKLGFKFSVRKLLTNDGFAVFRIK